MAQYESTTETTFVAAKFPYWGRGSSKGDAVRDYRRAGGRGRPKVIEVKWRPRKGETGGAYVDDNGGVRVPGKFIGKPKIVIDEKTIVVLD